jgi:serine/threonine protein kinase
MALLKRGQALTSDVSGQSYRLTSGMVGEGGFAEIYKAELLDSARLGVCIKATTNALAWHGEAYFGRLLAGEPAVRELLDAFPFVVGRGPRRRVRYLLALEWMPEGTTVYDLLSGPRMHWPETRVLREMRRLLKVLALLHARGICHGDITPRNVFVRNNRLVLGDLGIVTQSLRTRSVFMGGEAPAVYTPPWPEVKPAAGGARWTASADVYQVALLALSLLSGCHMESWEMRGRLLKDAPVSDDIKAWFMVAFGLCNSRYGGAGDALRYFQAEPARNPRAPSTLRGANVVFTGFLGDMTQAAAAGRARRAGATVQSEVNNQTTIVVKGRSNPTFITSKWGTKLIDARHRIVDGQHISIIAVAHFERLLTR